MPDHIEKMLSTPSPAVAHEAVGVRSQFVDEGIARLLTYPLGLIAVRRSHFGKQQCKVNPQAPYHYDVPKLMTGRPHVANVNVVGSNPITRCS